MASTFPRTSSSASPAIATCWPHCSKPRWPRLFLEHGFEKIEQPIVEAFASRIDYALTSHVDYKTELQEALARRGQAVNYAVLEVDGPPHDRRFTCAAMIDGEQFGVGLGESKKAAEQEAAKETLAKLGVRGVRCIVAERKLRFRSDLVTALSRPNVRGQSPRTPTVDAAGACPFRAGTGAWRPRPHQSASG